MVTSRKTAITVISQSELAGNGDEGRQVVRRRRVHCGMVHQAAPNAAEGWSSGSGREAAEPGPGDDELVEDREHDRAEEEADEAVCQGAADHAGEDDEHRRGEAPRHQDRLQHVVDERDRNEQQGEDEGEGRRVGHPDPDEHRQEDGRRADLDDAEEEDAEGDQAGAGDAGDVEDDPGEQRLQQRHADHAARDVADRRAGEVDEVRAARPRSAGWRRRGRRRRGAGRAGRGSRR